MDEHSSYKLTNTNIILMFTFVIIIEAIKLVHI